MNIWKPRIDELGVYVFALFSSAYAAYYGHLESTDCLFLALGWYLGGVAIKAFRRKKETIDEPLQEELPSAEDNKVFLEDAFKEYGLTVAWEEFSGCIWILSFEEIPDTYCITIREDQSPMLCGMLSNFMHSIKHQDKDAMTKYTGDEQSLVDLGFKNLVDKD